jgi:hypothetical protein
MPQMPALCKVLFAVVYVRIAPFFGITHKGCITAGFWARQLYRECTKTAFFHEICKKMLRDSAKRV